ncbi:MAG: hypothetical protein HFACDABA_00180 [Anaerolineales bacterium]|nr:hypothetical protein [Anaerolineales bacterium]
MSGKTSSPSMKNLSMTPSMPGDLPLVDLTENSRKVLTRRYVRRADDGKPAETVEAMFWRVAYNIAKVEATWGADVMARAVEYYHLLTSKKFFPNSPTFTGAGTPLGQLAACFVLPISDDMGRHSAGIFQTLRDAALIQQTGGGNGFSFSRLRPKGGLVKSSAGQATGPVGFLRVYDHAFGEIAQGGCLLPDTLVFTDKGLLRLDEIVNTEVPGWQEHSLTVPTDEGRKVSPRGFNNGVADVLRVHTREGLNITGTPNHKVKVMTDGGAQWKEIQNLSHGDWIVVRLGEHIGRMQALKKPTRQHGNQVMPNLPSMLDEEFAFFLGYLAGDGFVAQSGDDHRVGVSVAHSSYLMEEMPHLLERQFGVAVHRMQKPGDRSVTFVMDNRTIKDFLTMNGLTKRTSRDVSVPRLVRQSPVNVVGAYLRGLFEADGSLSHGYPVLTTSSSGLAREVSTLLIGLGCPVSIRTVAAGLDRWGDSETYHVRINSKVGLDAWREKIGCDQRSRFVAAYAWESDLRRESSYVLPNPRYWLQPVLDEITLEQMDSKGRGRNINFRASEPKLRRQALRYLRDDRNLTRSGFDLLKADHPEEFQTAPSAERLWFVEVRGVESAGQSLTLDLEVADNHTYLAYGMVTHNTRRGANMAVLRVDHPDVEEFITCKTNENQITNFNISVGITDAFMRAVQEDKEWELRFPDISQKEYRGWTGTLEQAEKAGMPIRSYGKIKARDLFSKIVKQAHHNGEPGVLFLDAANRSNPVPHLYPLEATNPCVTGDTLIYTDQGLRRADELASEGNGINVTSDARFGTETFLQATHVFQTGVKPVYRLLTREGYELRLTEDHRVMTSLGWAKTRDLKPGDRVHILNRKGGFGAAGTLEEGRVLGWLIGDGTVNIVRAVLSFFGAEKRELAPLFAEMVTNLVEKPGQRRAYPVGIVQVDDRDEARVASDRLRDWVAQYGITEEKKHFVPADIYAGSEEIQRGFLQALFTSDGQVNDGGEKGCSVRLSSSHLNLLKDVQRLLLNFGIASRIYENRRPAGYRIMPDGKGGTKEYFHQSQHDLAIRKSNLIRFANEIGFLTEAKQTRLLGYLGRMTRGPYEEPFLCTVMAVEPDGVEPVYDLHQPQTNAFVANGLVVHNCGEQWLGPYENCCLGSVNLNEHCGADGTVDWESLRQSVVTSTRFLDDVVEANAYVPAVAQLKEAAHRARRIGLGIMGLADLMYHVGVRYGSQEGQEFGAQVMEFVRYHTMKTSIELAEERGPFPAIAGSIYDMDNMAWTPPQPLETYRNDYARPAVEWEAIVKGIKSHGIRNAAQTTVAPTGTIATVAGCEGYGCEPVFALAYIRHVNDNGKDLKLTYASPRFDEALKKLGLGEEKRQEIVEQVMSEGTCRHVDALPKEIRDVFVVSADITAEEHVRMQAALQTFVDNSLSKTVNFHENATEEDVAKAYMLAWELGCKGITVYVTGSREIVVLETKATADKKAPPPTQPVAVPASPALIWHESKKPRPAALTGRTHNVDTPLGKAFITINENGGEQPFEVFINTAKAGSETAAVSEAIGRLISYILRLASPVAPLDRMREIVRQLTGIGGGRSLGFGPNRVRSLPDGVGHVLSDYLRDKDGLTAPVMEKKNGNGGHALESEGAALPVSKIGDLCPECGEAAVVNEEGCRKCYACGYSEC